MYKYLEMVINKSENLKDHTLGLNRKCDVINREISAGKEKIRVKLKIYETCLMPALLHELEVWGKVGKDGMNEIKKDSRESIKNDIQLANTNIIHWLNNGNRRMTS